MGLLNLIKEDESLKFISLKEAINLLAEKTNSNIYEVSAYLLNKNVPCQLDSHARQNNYRIEATSSSMDETHWYGENHCSFWLNYIAENCKHYPSFRVGVGAKYNKGCEENFWNRADFLNLECIKDLNVFSAEDTTIDKKQMCIWDTSYLNILKNDVPNPDPADSDLFDSSFTNYLNESDLTIDQEINTIKQVETQLPPHIKILAMNDYFTVIESACFISFDEPEKIQAYVDSGDFTYDAWRYGEHIQAVKVIENGIRANNLDIENDGMIPRTSLQRFLFDRNHVITGFNDNLSLLDQSRYGSPTIGHALPVDYQKQRDKLKKENDQLKARISELESRQNDITEPVGLNGIHAINQHKSDLQGMARVIASKKWADNNTVLIGEMADTVYREVAQYTTDMPETTDTVKNWIRPVAPVTAQKRGRPANKN